MSAWPLGPAMMVLAGAAQTAQVTDFDVRAQPLADALLAIARQGDVNVIAPARLTQGRSSRPVRGRMTAEQAVALALAGSGLTYRREADGTIVIVVQAAPTPPATPRPTSASEPVRVVPETRTPPPVAVGPDIFVWGQRRTELASDVPLSIHAFEGETLELAGVRKAMDLQQLDPALVVSAQSGAIIPFLRGIGNPASATPGNESSVPVYIDDAYYSRLYPAYLTLDHVERVEVLKGPQGTLFGRNSTGGLIQIFTRTPKRHFEADVEVGLGNFESTTAKAYLSGPVTERLAANLAISVHRQGEGWGTNRFTGKDAYLADVFLVRSKLLWEPDERWTVRLGAFHAREDSSIGTVQGGGIAGFPRGLPPDFDTPLDRPEGFYDIATNFPVRRRHRGWGATLRVEHEMDFADLTGISFYRRSRDPWTSEGDHTPYPWLQYYLPVRDRQLTQEWQLKSKPGSRASWILGLYYMRATAALEPTVVTGESIERQGHARLELSARQTIVSRAAYGQITAPLDSGPTRLTAGLRMTADRVRGRGDQFAVALDDGVRQPIADPVDDVSRFERFTWKLTLDRDLGPETIGYASYSRGFKSGTYNLLPLELPALNPEKVDAFEVGVKGALLDGRLQFDLAAFLNEVRDPQVQIVKTVGEVATNQFVNAERSRSKGLEFAAAVDLGADLSLRLAGLLLDAEFVRFVDAPVNAPLFVPPFGVVTTPQDVSGNDTPLSPSLKLNAGLTHRFSLAGADLTANATIAHQGRFRWEPDNRIAEPARTTLNASLTARPDAAPGWTVRLWANNLTGERYFSNVLTQSGPTGFMSSPGEPRTFGLTVGYDFSAD